MHPNQSAMHPNQGAVHPNQSVAPRPPARSPQGPGGFGAPAPPPPDLFGQGAQPQQRASVAPPLPTASRPPSAPPQAPGGQAGQAGPAGPRGPAPAPRRVDPFAAAPSAPDSNKKVTLVIDDSKVDSGELGRGGTLRAVAILIAGLAVGATVGWGIGGTTQEREQYNLALRDGKEIFAKVKETSEVLASADGQLKKAVAASAGGQDTSPQVDYAAIAGLVALPKPFAADAFHRRRYRAFPSDVVDNLFDYYNDINLLWRQFALLGVRTSGADRKAALDKSAEAAGQLINHQYGVVLSKSGDVVAGGLVYVDPAANADANRPQGQAPKVAVSAAIGSKSVERVAYVGQRDLGVNYEDYVILLDKLRSKDILGQSASAFAEYRSLLLELEQRMAKVNEAQARLLGELENIANIPEQGLL